MSRSPIEYLRHILDETSYLLDASHGVTKDRFMQDATMKRAFVRSIEIIGEATKQLPPELREQHPDIEWSKMARMRDRLIHGYFGIDYDIVWNVVTEKVPELHEALQRMLP